MLGRISELMLGVFCVLGVLVLFSGSLLIWILCLSGACIGVAHTYLD